MIGEGLLRYCEIWDGVVGVCVDFEKYVPFVAHVSARRGFFFSEKEASPDLLRRLYVFVGCFM